MFEAEIKEILDKKKDQLTTEVINGLKDSIKNSIVWKAEGVLTEEVEKFVKEHILPSVRKELMDSKEAYITLFNNTAKDVAVTIASKMAEKISAGLNDSWKTKKLIESLL